MSNHIEDAYYSNVVNRPAPLRRPIIEVILTSENEKKRLNLCKVLEAHKVEVSDYI